METLAVSGDGVKSISPSDEEKSGRASSKVVPIREEQDNGSSPTFIVWNGKSPDSGQFSQPPKIITRPGWQHTDNKKRLTLRESGLWTILKSYDYGGGEIFVSDKTLAQDAGIGEREVRKMRTSMRKKGYLDWKQRSGTTNQYILMAPDMKIYERKHGHQTSVSNTDPVSNQTLDIVLDNPGPKVPEGVGPKVPMKNTLLKNTFLKNTYRIVQPP